MNKSTQSIIHAAVTAFRRRLLMPDFDGFEAHYGCPVPLELQQFYGLKERLLDGVLYASLVNDVAPARFEMIQYAEPMDRDNWVRYGREFFRFATNTDGYGLLINPALAQSPVYADWGDGGGSNQDIEALHFTLAEVVSTFGSDPLDTQVVTGA